MRYALYLLVLALAACEQQCATIALKDWTPEEQRRMADEVHALPADSLLVPAMNDYARLRREAR